jgi:SH3-like domain-containing protein
MPLAQCPDCGGKVSTDAKACPHCGRPTSTLTPSGTPPAAKKSPSAQRIGCFVVAGILGIIVLIAICNHPSSDQQSQATVTSSSKSSSAPLAVYVAKAANIRRGPGTSYGIARKASEGERLEYLEKSGEWYKLTSSEEGAEEWVHGSTVMTEAEARMTKAYTADQIAAARSVMENIRGLATIDDDGTSMEVHFNYGVLPGLDREQTYRLISAAADADAILSGGKARRINFYDPTGERIGTASPFSGIKLTD